MRFTALRPKIGPGVFLLSFILNAGIIFPMTSKPSFLKTTVLLTGLFYLAGMTIPSLVPPAHALFWEDDSPDNDPNEIKQRPEHFSLFDWIGDAEHDAKKGDYRRLDIHDHGPGVNGSSRAGILILSGTIGAGLGVLAAYEFSPLNTDLTSAFIIDGTLGLCAGVVVGVLIMPKDYDVDPTVYNQYLQYRQASLEEPVRMQVQKAFHPTVTAFSLKF
jgi:hypothetical protein